MPGSPYNGLNGNISLQSGIAIQSSTVGNPTTIQTAVNHNLLTGDYVNIYGHATNTVANGVSLPITFVDATHFTIPTNTTGGTNGGATGHVYALNFVNNIGLNPANGDALAAATWVPGMSCTQDRTTGLIARAAPTKTILVAAGNIANNANPFSSQWFSMTTSTAVFTPVLLSGTPITWIIAANPDLCVSTSDTIELTLDWNYDCAGNGGAATNAAFALAWSFVPVGASASYNIVGGSRRWVNAAAGVVLVGPMCNSGWLGNSGANVLSLPGGNTVGNLTVQLWVNTNGANNTVQGVADYVLWARGYRQTGFNP